MSGGTRGIVYGALGGAIGAACMTPLRLAARRRGWIDKTVSQTAEEWLSARVGARSPSEPAVHHTLDQMLHVGYGAALGVGYALTLGRRPGRGRGITYGILTWLFGSWAVMPAIGAKRPPWRKSLIENAVDLTAHGLFGIVAALVSGEMSRQPSHGPTSDQHRYRTRTG